MRDFLEAWLVEQKPDVAIGYISNRAYHCLDIETPEGSPLNRGMAPYRLFIAMKEINQLLGPQSSLEGVTMGVRVVDPEARVVTQPNHARFVLYDLPEGRGKAAECMNRNMPAHLADSKSYGKYFASVLYLKAEGGKSGTLSLLWQKEGEHWKIVSWESEPSSDTESVPDLRQQKTATTLQRLDAVPSFLTATTSFLTAWGDGKIEEAAGYFSDRSLACHNLFLEEGEEPIGTDDELRARLKAGLGRVSERLQAMEDLSGVVKPVEISHPDVRIVTHDREEAFTLVNSPEYIAEGLGCQLRLAGGEPPPAPGSKVYGHYYGTLFQLRLAGEDPAVLVLLWGKEDDRWRIVAYDVATP